MTSGTRDATIQTLVAANRILADRGIVDGFGHVSTRDPDDRSRHFIARSMAPALVDVSDIISLDAEGNPPHGESRPLYLERFIHAAIYRARDDVGAVIHHHAPSLLSFGATAISLRPISHMAGFLHESVAIFEISAERQGSDLLIRDAALGAAHARCLGQGCGTLMRGHGATVVGEDLVEAVYRAIYMELNARVQSEALRLGEPRFLDAGEAAQAAATNKGQMRRAWDLWCRDVGYAEGGYAEGVA